MKKHFILIILLALTNISYAQLTPAGNSEFCPNTNIQFSYVIHGKPENFSFSEMKYLSAVINTYVYDAINLKTTVYFTLNFADVNYDHFVRLNWQTRSGSTTSPYTATWTFNRIKSLHAETAPPYFTLSPNTFPPCQITTSTISFTKLKWKNSTAAPATEFGEINDYEYSVPAGWSVNGSVSSGPNDYKLGTNSATIKSNATSAGEIKVRAVNKCATGLAVGPWASTTIARPKPAITFDAPNPICGTVVYQARNVPSAFTNVNWQLSPSGLGFFGNPNSTMTQVVKQGNGLGTVEFKISSPGCPQAFTYNTLEITKSTQLIFGEPSTITKITRQSHISDCYIPTYTYTAVGGIGATKYRWYTRRTDKSSFDFIRETIENNVDISESRPGRCDDFEIKVEAINGCNMKVFKKIFTHCQCAKGDPPKGRNLSLRLSPNPSGSNLSISLPESNEGKTIKQIRIMDKFGSVKKEIKTANQSSVTIGISELKADIYTIQIFDGKEWHSSKFLKY